MQQKREEDKVRQKKSSKSREGKNIIGKVKKHTFEEQQP